MIEDLIELPLISDPAPSTMDGSYQDRAALSCIGCSAVCPGPSVGAGSISSSRVATVTARALPYVRLVWSPVSCASAD